MEGFTHHACLLMMLPSPKKWYYPHCSRLPQFKRYSWKKSRVKIKAKANALALTHASLLCDTICICKVKATKAHKLVECHGPSCMNGKFFHLQFLGLKRMPTNHKTTWRCYIYRTTGKTNIPPPTTCSSFTLESSSSDDSDPVECVGTSQGYQNKTGALANLTKAHFDLIYSPHGWLGCDIIQQASFTQEKPKH